MAFTPGYNSCDVCGLTAPLSDGEDLLEDTGAPLPDVFRVPPGWMVLTVSQRIPNPNYAILLEERNAVVEQQVEAAMAMMDDTQNPAEKAQIRMGLAAQAQSQLPPMDEPEFVLEEVHLHYSPDYVEDTLKKIPGLDEDEEPVVVPAAPKAEAQDE